MRPLLAQASSELLGLQDTFDLTDRLAVSHPVVAEPFLGNRRALRYFQKVLKELLSEGLPIKDLVTRWATGVVDRVIAPEEPDDPLEDGPPRVPTRHWTGRLRSVNEIAAIRVSRDHETVRRSEYRSC